MSISVCIVALKDSKRKVHRIMESGMYRERSRDLDLVKLDSCFGGLAIYKYARKPIICFIYSAPSSAYSLIVYCMQVSRHRAL